MTVTILKLQADDQSHYIKKTELAIRMKYVPRQRRHLVSTCTNNSKLYIAYYIIRIHFQRHECLTFRNSEIRFHFLSVSFFKNNTIHLVVYSTFVSEQSLALKKLF